MCYTCGCYVVHQFFMVILSSYATLSDVISGNFDTNLPVATCFIYSGFMIFAICEGAYNVTRKVSTTVMVFDYDSFHADPWPRACLNQRFLKDLAILHGLDRIEMRYVTLKNMWKVIATCVNTEILLGFQMFDIMRDIVLVVILQRLKALLWFN
jgi:hypothetical protein